MLRLALRLWYCPAFKRRLLEVWEDVDDARESSGRKDELGGRGDGNRCSRLMALYFSKSPSLIGEGDGRRLASRGEALNSGTTAEAVV